MPEHIERIEDPEDTSRENLAWHLARYRFAARLVRDGDRVLDAGCGVGYGTSTLTAAGAKVWGCDIAPEAVEAAKRRNEPGTFQVADLHELPYEDDSFEGAVNFEVLEHLERPSEFLDQIVRVLVPGGWFVVTTPNPAYEVDNPFHHHELDLDEFESVLREKFPTVELMGQPWTHALDPAGAGSRLRDADKLQLRKVLPQSVRDTLRRLMKADGRAVTDADLDRVAVQPMDDMSVANPYVALCRLA